MKTTLLNTQTCHIREIYHKGASVNEQLIELDKADSHTGQHSGTGLLLLKVWRKDLSIIFINKPGLSERAKRQLCNTLLLNAGAADCQVNYWQFCFSLFPVVFKLPHR